MWLPLVGPLPTPAWFTDLAKLGYVVAVRFAGAVLANILIWSGEVLYPAYGRGGRAGHRRPRGPGAAGNLMMIETGAVTLGLFAWLFFRAANRGVEKQELLDLADLHGVELDPARAARAVNAGQGAALRERILGRAEHAAPRQRDERQPLPVRAGLRGRHRQPRRRDRRGAADGAVLRRLHDRLGEHDRRGAGRALDRLLAGRPARRPAPERCGACAWWCSAPRCCWRCPVRRPAVPRGLASTRSTRSRRAPSSARWSACCS